MSAWFICAGCLSDAPLQARVLLVHECGHGCGYCPACVVVKQTDPCLACSGPRDTVPLRETEKKYTLAQCEAWIEETADTPSRPCECFATFVTDLAYVCGYHIGRARITRPLPDELHFKLPCSGKLSARKGRPRRRCKELGPVLGPVTLCLTHLNEAKRRH